MCSKRKLQGASLFFLFAAIYWALSETGREDPSGRRTGASEQVYGFPQGRVVPIGADYDADAVRFRADMATGALEPRRSRAEIGFEPGEPWQRLRSRSPTPSSGCPSRTPS